MVREVTKSEYNQIVSIWNMCFGDLKDDIESFLLMHEENSVFVGKYILVGGEEILASFLSLIPAKLKLNNSLQDCYYVYAVCTHPDYRKRGYCEEMLEYIRNKYFKDMPGFFVPQESYLIDYYNKRGYVLLHSDEDKGYSEVYEQDMLIFKTSRNIIEYSGKRDKLLDNVNCIMWDKKELKYIFYSYHIEEGEEKNIPLPIYPSLMVSHELKQILEANGVEDIYFTLAME